MYVVWSFLDVDFLKFFTLSCMPIYIPYNLFLACSFHIFFSLYRNICCHFTFLFFLHKKTDSDQDNFPLDFEFQRIRKKNHMPK